MRPSAGKQAKSRNETSRQQKNKHKKCQYTLRKKNHIFEKSPLPAILCDFTLLTIIEHAFSIFYQKNIDKFTILHRNFVFFSIFFRITICKPNLICQKCVKNTIAKYFLFPCKITINIVSKSWK